ARCAGVSALAVLDDFGAAFQWTYLRNSGDVLAVPLHAEFEVLVRIEALRVDRELCHAEPRPNSLPQLAMKWEPICAARPVRDCRSAVHRTANFAFARIHL